MKYVVTNEVPVGNTVDWQPGILVGGLVTRTCAHACAWVGTVALGTWTPVALEVRDTAMADLASACCMIPTSYWTHFGNMHLLNYFIAQSLQVVLIRHYNPIRKRIAGPSSEGTVRSKKYQIGDKSIGKCLLEALSCLRPLGNRTLKLMD